MRVLPIKSNFSMINNSKTKTNFVCQSPNIADRLIVSNQQTTFGNRVTLAGNFVKGLEKGGCAGLRVAELKTSLEYPRRNIAGTKTIFDLLEKRNLSLKLATDADSCGTCLLVDCFNGTGTEPINAVFRKTIPLEDGRVPDNLASKLSENNPSGEIKPNELDRILYRLLYISTKK